MLNINWIYGEKKQNLDELKRLEEQFNVNLPDEYRKIVSVHDGASPIPQNFTVSGEEKVFNYLIKISLLQTMATNICREFNSDHHLIPFADDPAGNFICFDFTEGKNNPKIAFFDLDIGQSVEIAEDFNVFLSSLH